MGPPLRRVLVGLVLGWAMGTGGTARAADEEIQVYMNEINAPHRLGLDLHVNYVPSGDGTVDYPGAQPGRHRLRVTPEFSYALDNHFELGAYLPLATLDAGGTLRADGWKVRLKWLGSHTEHGFFYGVNYEIGRVGSRLDQNAWNNEVKLIAGWDSDKWIIGANANLGFALSGPAKTPADVTLTTKLGYKLTKDTTIGVESYNGLGTIRRVGHFSDNDQSTFVAIDSRVGRWDFNFGVGKGYASSKDDVIVKLIIGVPVGK